MLLTCIKLFMNQYIYIYENTPAQNSMPFFLYPFQMKLFVITMAFQISWWTSTYIVLKTPVYQ